MTTYEDVRRERDGMLAPKPVDGKLRCAACHQDKEPEDFRLPDRQPIIRRVRKCRACWQAWDKLYERGLLPLKRQG